MKVINTGVKYNIYPNDVQTFDQLPPQSYVVRFNEMTGFSLEKYSEFAIKEKVYGVHDKKVNKVINSFNINERNIGVILSGDKGIGKSLFSKMLAKKAIENGIPVIVVNQFYPDIASFIESIEQEVMVLFDEFDKTFGEVKASENMSTPQSSLLTLFDGVSQGKKLYVITCNDLYKLNSFLVNRPGRFHYHFRFEYPTSEDITTYLKDKVKEQYHNEIKNVVAFSRKVQLNYDCLRSIAFELNLGETFENAIQDLNIMNINYEEFYVTLHFANGYTLKEERSLDLWDNEELLVGFEDSDGTYVCKAIFTPSDNKYDFNKRCLIIPGDKIRFELYKNVSNNEKYAGLKETPVEYISLKRKMPDKMHYVV